MNVVTATANGAVVSGPVLIEATCPASQSPKRPIGASYSVNAGSFYASYSVSTFSPTPTGWRLGVVQTGVAPAGTMVPISITVYCATILS